MKRKFRHSIQLRLSLAFALVALLVAAAAGGIAFYDTYRETHELQDELLRQTAVYVEPDLDVVDPDEGDDDLRIFIQTPATPAKDLIVPLPPGIGEGFHTLREPGDDDTYRVFVKHTPQGPVAVLQENEYREEFALRAAWGSAIPLLVLVPLMIVLTMVVLRRTLRPVRALSHEVENRREHDMAPLDDSAIPAEIHGFVVAINRLLARTGAAMQQQQRFIADAAHELRSPMTALSLQAERLAKQPLPEDAREQVAALQQGIRRNHQLLEQLLSLARAQAAENRVYTAQALQPLLARVIADVLPLAEVKGQDIGVVSDGNPSICADETDLYTLIKTLADNAIRYTPAGSRIDLSAQVQHGQLLLCVEDNGPGIPAAERRRVLDPFYRILGSGEQGTGLGLSIAQTIAQRYGGRIELADSRQFASGLRVTVYLPLS
ncbi:signal transduction histidine kinase [Neisseria sp. HSC-16F19]|nr:ATP-binding protein [Neisseria sp. HSC-16F19]MCP2041755.1 signal transduction histidine kinase [Neisseria sp. HSC-16F19]